MILRSHPICVLVAAPLIGPIITPYVSKLFTSIIDLIYYGADDNKTECPMINLRLISAYRVERCFLKCAEECERQISWHPMSSEIWAEYVLACRGLGNTSLEATIYNKAISTLGCNDAPEDFTRVISAMNKLSMLPKGMRSQFDR